MAKKEKPLGQTKALDRYLSPIDVWAMAFGCMVGWGVFAMPGTTFLPVAGPAGTVIAMLAGMLIMLIIGNNFSFLMSRSSMTGGVYSYTKEAFGRDHAFLSCWFLCLSYLTIVFLNGTALFFIVRILFSDTVQTGFSYTVAGNTIYLGETVISALALAGFGILFIAAKPLLQRLHTALSVILLIGIVVTAAFCLPRVIGSERIFSFGTLGLNRGYAVFSLIVLAPWAFVGFEVTSFETAHFKYPANRTRRIIVIAIIIAALAYISMVLISVAVVPDGFSSWQEYITELNSAESSLRGMVSIPTFFAAKTIMGTPGLTVMIVTAVAAILTGIIGGYRATTRVLSTMAEDHILSEKFSKTSYSILFIMALSILLSLLGRNTLNWFVDLTSFGAIVGFGYTSAAAYKNAKAEGNKKVILSGIIGTVISIALGIVQIVPRLAAMEAMSSEAFLLLSLWCLLGFVFYWRTVRRSTLTEYSGISTSGIVLFTLLVYSAMMWLAKRLATGDSAEQMKSTLLWGGIILMAIVFVGLAVMLYVQNVVREKHERTEREKIHAVESSLAKSRFLFNMSHDIRTPMNAIIGYTNLALKEPVSPETKGYLEKVIASSQHLLALINDILEMSRIESGKIELEYVPADLCTIFDGMRDLFSEQMKQKKIDFQVHTSQVQNRYVWCDRKNLNRVLEIRVKDTGIGMSKEFAERMFNAFERERTSTDSGVEGTGLGLSITKSIVDLMGGTIDVLTAPGNGTQMVIRLKFKPADEKDVDSVDRKAAEQPADSAPEKPEIDFSQKRLLLVEDNEINMEIAQMVLSQAGFMVDTAENGQIAVDLVSASAPGYYDAILMDIQMPVMDGFEATRTIRSLPDPSLARIPIIAMTANAFKEDVQETLNAGMEAHIAKPIDVEILLKTLTDVLLASEKTTGSLSR